MYGWFKYNTDEDVAPLIITSDDDEIISYKLSLNLANYFDEIEDIMILSETTHNSYFISPYTQFGIYEYLQSRL